MYPIVLQDEENERLLYIMDVRTTLSHLLLSLFFCTIRLILICESLCIAGL